MPWRAQEGGRDEEARGAAGGLERGGFSHPVHEGLGTRAVWGRRPSMETSGASAEAGPVLDARASDGPPALAKARPTSLARGADTLRAPFEGTATPDMGAVTPRRRVLPRPAPTLTRAASPIAGA